MRHVGRQSCRRIVDKQGQRRQARACIALHARFINVASPPRPPTRHWSMCGTQQPVRLPRLHPRLTPQLKLMAWRFGWSLVDALRLNMIASVQARTASTARHSWRDAVCGRAVYIWTGVWSRRGVMLWLRRPCLWDKTWFKPYKLQSTNISIYRYIIYFENIKYSL